MFYGLVRLSAFLFVLFAFILLFIWRFYNFTSFSNAMDDMRTMDCRKKLSCFLRALNNF